MTDVVNALYLKKCSHLNRHFYMMMLATFHQLIVSVNPANYIKFCIKTMRLMI